MKTNKRGILQVTQMSSTVLTGCTSTDPLEEFGEAENKNI